MKLFHIIFFLLLITTQAFAVVHNVSTVAAINTALSTAVAGDLILVADGTYTSSFLINGNSGTSVSPIVIKAQNRHGAVIVGAGTSVETNTAFTVSRNWWVIDGFETRNQWKTIKASAATNLEVKNCLIHDFLANGIEISSGATAANIHHNVIGPAIQTSTANAWAGVWLDSSDNHIVSNNAIFSVTLLKHIQPFQGNSYNVFCALVNGILVQGNIMMDSNKGTGIRIGTFEFFGDPTGPWSANNTVRDNIIAHGQSGSIAFSENARDSFAINNLLTDVMFAGLTGKGNDPGNNSFSHNTTIMTSYGNIATRLDEVSSVPSKNTTYRSNLHYSSVNVPTQKLLYTFFNPITANSDNLFWSPVSGTANWFTNYTPVASDILSEPIFVNAAGGDFSLATGSPGKSEAFEGTDIGIAYNSFLTVEKVNEVLNLPVQEWTNPGSSTSQTFTVAPNSYYQCFVYIPDTGFFTGNQTYNVNGQAGATVNIQTDVVNGGWILTNPNRYMYVGTFPANGTQIAVTWQNATAAGKILIRRMPTPLEAYNWIVPPPFKLSLTKLRLLNSELGLARLI